MPSKTRSKPPQHIKRKTIALPDGWSIITSSESKSKSNSVPTHLASTSPHLDPEADYSPPTPDRTASIIAEVQSYFERWRSSKCALDLSQILRRRKETAGDIDNAICAGLGSLNTESLVQRRVRMWQFVVFLWLVEEVQSEFQEKDGKIRCHAQEPRFTPTDVEVLKHFNVTVLPELNGKEYITEGTLLYAPFLPWSLLLGEFLRMGSPGVCVCNDVGESVEMLAMRIRHGTKSIDSEGILLLDEDLKVCEKIGRVFLEGRRAVKIPEFEFHGECLKLMIYVQEEELESG